MKRATRRPPAVARAHVWLTSATARRAQGMAVATPTADSATAHRVTPGQTATKGFDFPARASSRRRGATLWTVGCQQNHKGSSGRFAIAPSRTTRRRHARFTTFATNTARRCWWHTTRSTTPLAPTCVATLRFVCAFVLSFFPSAALVHHNRFTEFPVHQAECSWSKERCCAVKSNDCSSGRCWAQAATAGNDFLYKLSPGTPTRYAHTGKHDGYQWINPSRWPRFGGKGRTTYNDLSFGDIGAPGQGGGGYCDQGWTYQGSGIAACGGVGNWGGTHLEVWRPS